MTIQEMIDVLKAFANGEEIEQKATDGPLKTNGKAIEQKATDGPWKAMGFPFWNFSKYAYRVKPKPRVRWIVECNGASIVCKNRAEAMHQAYFAINTTDYNAEVFRVREVLDD